MYGKQSSSVTPHGVNINWHHGLNTKFMKKVQKYKRNVKQNTFCTLLCICKTFCLPVMMYLHRCIYARDCTVWTGGLQARAPHSSRMVCGSMFPQPDAKEEHGQVHVPTASLSPTADASGTGTRNKHFPAVYRDPCTNCLLPAPSKTAGVCGCSATKCTFVMRSNV